MHFLKIIIFSWWNFFTVITIFWGNIVKLIFFKVLNMKVLMITSRSFSGSFHCVMLLSVIQALSGDFQCVCGKMYAQILLGVRWCAMSTFLFLKLYSFIKGIMWIHSIFKKPKTNVFILHLLTFKNIYNLQQNDV